jgi:hypothetical protein
MRTQSVFMALLVVAFVVVSTLPDRRSVPSVITGTVGAYVAGEWIAISNETTDPRGVHVTVRDTTAFEGDPALIKPGIRVTVWYRSAGERRPLADKVRVVPAAAPTT